MKPRVLAITICFFSALSGWAQTWSITNAANIQAVGNRDIVPGKSITYHIEPEELKQILLLAPDELDTEIAESEVMLRVGLADGSIDVFRIVRYSMIEEELALKYPDVITIRGISTSNPYRRLRADWTVNGFRALIRDENGMMYIDPFQRNDLAHRIAYFKRDFHRADEWSCGFEGEKIADHSTQRAGDCQFRSYRLVVAATGEYSNFFGATSPAQSDLVLAEVITAVDRVNEVYEVDIAVRLVLIGNTEDVFYYNPATDPYSGSACNQLSQNQTTCDNVIGSANYDIGHVFSVGSGGCAGLGVICSGGNKARGATGLNPPSGDPFYIDYVAHEMGHQFGGNHTFNGTAGSCSGNRVPAAAYEPGSGSTIMAYAGICGAQNVQPNSDAYFHAKSIAEISNKLLSTNCAVFLSFNNTAPVANATPDYTIPISTPFVLTANATDANNDPLTYCWEQYDLEVTSTEPPASNDVDGPMFRSFIQNASPNRYIPRLSDLTSNTNYTWEVLPSVSRTMNFRMTVRDYHNVAGCTDEDNVVITTASTAGPFTVTSQNAGATWLEGSTQTITWNVANTTASPVSCPNVDIRLSYDGGFTYPTALLLNETNDGSANVTIPAGTTTTARVMVKGSNNIFFDINNQNITINPGLPNYTLSLNPASVTECNDGTVQTTVNVGSFMGYSDPVTLSLLNAPPGAIVTFLPSVVIPGNSSLLTISNLNGLSGTYTPAVRGSSTTGIQEVNFPITLVLASSGPVLTSPVNDQENVDLKPTLMWGSVANATSYEYQLSINNSFNPIAFSGSVTTNQVWLSSLLDNDTRYYWRVRATNLCGAGAWSSAFEFRTMICESYMSTDVPVTIPSQGQPTVYSDLFVPMNATVTDINVISLTGTHSWVDDLQFSLITPGNTEILFWNRPCNDEDNFNIHLDDEAPNSDWPCPPTDGLTYKPSAAFTGFDGVSSSGTWVLKIKDIANGDGGSLNSWGLRVCRESECTLMVTEPAGSGPGSLPMAYACAGEGDTIILSGSLSGQTINIGSSPMVLNKSVTIISESPAINVTGSGVRVFEITMGSVVELTGMMITAGTSMNGGALVNTGTLTLKNLSVEKNTSVLGATLVSNSSTGLIKWEGSSSINQ